MLAKHYLKHKPSGVEWLGDVPEHWEVQRGRFCMRVNPPSDQLRRLTPDDDVSFVPMDNVGEYGGLRLDITRTLGDIGFSYTEFQDGDVVVAKITPCFENGKGALASGLTNGAALGTTELHVLRVGTGLDRRFLFYLTISSIYRQSGEAEMYGAGGQKRVPPEFSKNFRVTIPPIAEQRAIADFLDRETGRIDRLVAKKRELIEELKEKRVALISRTVTRGLNPNAKLKPTGVEWLGDIPEHWEIWKHSHLFQSSMGQTILREDVSDAGKVPVLSATEEYAVFGYLDSAKDILNRGDLVIPARGNSIGYVKLVRELCTTTQTTIYSKHLTSRVDPTFAFFFLIGHRESLFYFDRTAIPQLTVGQVSGNPFLVPPLPEQRAIADYLDRETGKIDLLMEKVNAAVERLQEYRTALITAAVTGKIDVKDAVA